MTGSRVEVPATEILWSHRDRRVPAVVAAHAFTGLPNAMLEQAARIAFTASAELEALLAGMDQAVRELPSELTTSSQRCVHEVRGPIVWSETVAARGNSLGDEDVFVCSTVARSYDCMQNRLLCWLLQRASLALKATRGAMGAHLDPGQARRIEESALAARHWRDNPRLLGVSPGLPTRRDAARLRSMRRRTEAMTLLVEAWGRANQPFTGADVAALVDRRTLHAHREVLWRLSERGETDFVVGCENSSLSVGGLTWRHPSSTDAARVRARVSA